MSFFNLLDLSYFEFIFFIVVVLTASIVRGFSGFGFSAITISSLSFIFPPIEIVPVILILEVAVSIFMIPVIFKNINWNFVFTFLVGISLGSPIGLYILRNSSETLSHFIIALLVSFFSFLIFKGYKNPKLNKNIYKFLTGIISGIANGIGTLAGLPLALYLLLISAKSVSIRASLAALFCFTDSYAFTISAFTGMVNQTVIYRALPLIIVLPLGVFIGNKFFKKSNEETYKKYVLKFLIIISIFGIAKLILGLN